MFPKAEYQAAAIVRMFPEWKGGLNED